jgi:hypothetical protein
MWVTTRAAICHPLLKQVLSAMRRVTSRIAWPLFIVGSAILALAAGCGRSAFRTAHVEGSVTVDGEPVERGNVSFLSLQAGGGPNATARIFGGRYEAEGVPQGKVRVYLHAVKETQRTVTINQRSERETVSVIPEKFHTGLEIEVGADRVEHDFVLSSK